MPCTTKANSELHSNQPQGSSALYFDKASSGGKLLAEKEPNHKVSDSLLESFNHALNDYQKGVDKKYSKFEAFKLINAVQYDANDIPIKRSPDTYWVTYLYGLLWRHGYRYRSEIGRIVETVRGNDTTAFEPGNFLSSLSLFTA